MIHDFCGGLEEELMRNNFIMIYELIDELIVRKIDDKRKYIQDYGHPQITHPDTLRKFVHT